ncbi:amino acid ABC transporter permease [Pseudaminobacter arsenicus]|uniref:Amino acid ABC transporter permease n=1 Tax=Borborobacter arsenicus TaxID=1851146 RepID=A0A432V1P0_9HYPH|nr:amino acid ABC transporter permease [Pseudaminobacter arsenicus]RUM96008.1 amino acid ABC transporter permease [Pseudaminobacter arsenicus]
MGAIEEIFFNGEVIGRYWGEIVQGLMLTAEVSLLTVVLGIMGGLLLAVLKCFSNVVVDVIFAVFIDVFRTIPILVILFLVYFALPYAGLRLSPLVTTVATLSLVLTAYSAETFWVAIQAIPRGQTDAARALNIGAWSTIAFIILPQAIRLSIPLLCNRAIAITKGTALGAAVALPELLGSAQSAMSIAANPSPLTLAAGLYVLFFIPLVLLSRWLERRSTRERRA